MVRKTVHRLENNYLLQPAMLETGLQTPHDERKMEAGHMQEMQELRSSLEKQEYFTFFRSSTSDGCKAASTSTTCKEEKLVHPKAQRKDVVDRKAIELMLKKQNLMNAAGKQKLDFTRVLQRRGGDCRNIRSMPNEYGLIRQHRSRK